MPAIAAGHPPTFDKALVPLALKSLADFRQADFLLLIPWILVWVPSGL
jgi:hypothetical protein